MITPVLKHPWLTLDLGGMMRVISWAPFRGGIVTARRIMWREVRNADLPPELDVAAWLDQEAVAHALQDDVVMLTSRKIATFTSCVVNVADMRAQAVATVGLSNAVRAGPMATISNDRRQSYGTINIAVILNHDLSDIALIEAQSVATSARTAAIMEAGVMTGAGLATGTGTDCIAIAAPMGHDPYCGLHTAQGQAVAAAVYQAVQLGATQWITETGGRPYDLG